MGNDMTTDELQKPMERLLNAVVEKAVTEGLDLRRLRGVALYDSQKDSFIKALPEFVGGKGLAFCPYLQARSSSTAVQMRYFGAALTRTGQPTPPAWNPSVGNDRILTRPESPRL